jgi:hypothetical protein
VGHDGSGNAVSKVVVKRGTTIAVRETVINDLSLVGRVVQVVKVKNLLL